MYEEKCKMEAPIKVSITNEIQRQLGRILDKSKELSLLSTEKLKPLYFDYPVSQVEPAKDEREFPPLFADIRAMLNGIELQIDNIGRTIENVEL